MLCQENLLHIILYICTNSPIVSVCIIPRVICFMHIYKYLWLDILKDHMAVYKFLSFNDIYIDCDCRYIWILFYYIILYIFYFNISCFFLYLTLLFTLLVFFWIGCLCFSNSIFSCLRWAIIFPINKYVLFLLLQWLP